MAVKDLSEYDNTKRILLSDKSNEAIKLIKTKLRKTAQTIIEIGDLLVEAIDNEPTDYKKEFYTQLGMSERSGQRYMQIAKSEVIKTLKNDEPELLENMTMTDLVNKINQDKKTDTKGEEKPKIETFKRAENIYKKYKNDTATLEEIISNLQIMLEKHNKENKVLDATPIEIDKKQ